MEESELKLEASSIEELIFDALKEMGRIYELAPLESLKSAEGKKNSFADGDGKQGLINAAEALECFFIPYFFVKGVREKFWEGELISLEHISKTIKYLVNDYADDKEVDGRLKLSGTPYVNFKCKGETTEPSECERNMDFIDTACFVLSALLDAKAINYERKYLIKEGIIDDTVADIIPSAGVMEMVNNRICQAAELIKECDLGIGKGWAYTDDLQEPKLKREDQLYFTWNALETLELVSTYIDKAPHLIPQKLLDDEYYMNLKSKFAEKQSYLVSSFLSDDKPSLNISSGRKAAVQFEGEIQGNYYYNLFALVSLMITGCKRFDKLNSAFDTLIGVTTIESNYKKIRSEGHGSFDIVTALNHKKEWKERAFICLFSKAIGRYKRNNLDEFNRAASMSDNYKNKPSRQLLSDCVNTLRNERLADSKVWDNEKKKYTIYYTERAIEALVRIYEAEFYLDTEITAYYEQSEKATVKKQITGESTAPVIQINLSDEIQKSIQGIVEAKVREILTDEKILAEVKEQMRKGIELDQEKMDKAIVKFFQYASANLANTRAGKKPDRKYQDFANSMSEVMGETLIKAFAQSLYVIGQKHKQKVDVPDLAERLEKGLGYMVNWENSDQGVIDFGKTISKIQENSFVEFTKKKA